MGGADTAINPGPPLTAVVRCAIPHRDIGGGETMLDTKAGSRLANLWDDAKARRMSEP